MFSFEITVFFHLQKNLFQNLGATIGTAFINLLKPVVSVLNKIVAAVTSFAEKVVNALGVIFGWTIEISNVGISSDFEDAAGFADDLAGGTGKAADNAKKLKQQLQGFDELNVLQSDKDSGGGGGGVASVDPKILDALKEYDVITAAVGEVLDLTLRAFKNGDPTIAITVEPLEQVIDDVASRVKKRQIKNLQNGKGPTIETGINLSDDLTNMRRISDHCSNIAVCIIQSAHSTFETHSYLQHVKYTNQPEFLEEFEKYKEKYSLE